MRTSDARTWRISRLEWLLAVMVIAGGFAIRVVRLDHTPFWCDEAESSINALTILQHGYPADRYLGMPIYENTLVRRWPGNAEYEFKDISYSDRGMAVYHGWLPLYSMAASFALHGVKPAPANSSLDIQYNQEEAKRLTRAGRLPSLLFAMVFLGIVFLAGHAFYGKDAAWIALLTAATHPFHIRLSREARYYSATVALSTGCCLMVWLMVTKGRWRDFLVGAALFVLLFHTHLLSFVSACGFLGVMLLMMLYQGRLEFRKTAAFGAIVAAGTVPWVLLTEFHRHQSQIPRGWSLLTLPGDFIRYSPLSLLHVGMGLVFILFLIWLKAGQRAVPDRLRSPFLQSLLPSLFLTGWIFCGYFCFVLFMPAASFFVGRISLSYWGAGILAASMMCASIARVLVPRFRGWSIPAGMVLMMLAMGHTLSITDRRSVGTNRWTSVDQLVAQLESLKLKKDTKLYAAPNDHLILTFYTKVPVQSIAPIRKAFLNEYPGDIVIVKAARDWRENSILAPVELQKTAAQNHVRLSDRDAENLSAELLALDYQQTTIREMTGRSTVSMEAVPEFARKALQTYQAVAGETFVSPFENDPLMIFRGLTVTNWPDFMDVFFYRFVDPESRRGAKRNDAERLRGSRAYVLIPSGFVVYHSPGGSSRDAAAGVDFTFVREDEGVARSESR